MIIVPVLLAVMLLLSVIAAPFVTLRMRASKPGLLADEQEARALLGLLRKARETFPQESDECRELHRGRRLLANNQGINVGACLTPRQIRILWPFVVARIKELLARRVDKTTYADAISVQDEQFELYLYRRFTVRMRKKGLVPSATRERPEQGGILLCAGRGATKPDPCRNFVTSAQRPHFSPLPRDGFPRALR